LFTLPAIALLLRTYVPRNLRSGSSYRLRAGAAQN